MTKPYGIEAPLNSWEIMGMDQHVSAADVNFIFKAQHDRSRTMRPLQLTFERVDCNHFGLLARGQGDDCISALHSPKHDLAGKAAIVEVTAES